MADPEPATIRSAHEILHDALEQAEGPRSLALIGIGRALLVMANVGWNLLDEARNLVLVNYLRALLSNPEPGVDTVAQIIAVSDALETRLGLNRETS